MNLSISKVRIFQWVIAVVLLALSGRLLKDKTSLQAIVSDLNEISNSFNLTEILNKRDYYDDQDSRVLKIDTNWKSSVISMSSSALNVLSHPLLAFAPNMFTQKGYTVTRSLLHTKNGYRTTTGLFSKAELSYLGSAAGSEGALNVMYFANFVYQVAEYGSFSCDGVSSLLQDYNLTGEIDDKILQNYFNIYENGYYNITEDADTGNLTSAELQSQLLISLSRNCQLKKASIAMNFLNWCGYLVTSSVVVASGFNLYQSLKKKDVLTGVEDKQEYKLSYNKGFTFPEFSLV